MMTVLIWLVLGFHILILKTPTALEGIEEINNYYQRQLEHFISNVVPEGKKAALDAKRLQRKAASTFWFIL